MSKTSITKDILLEDTKVELFKVSALAKVLRMAILCQDYTSFKIEDSETEVFLELIENIASKQNFKIYELL